jgi:ATP-dependent DNA ligase
LLARLRERWKKAKVMSLPVEPPLEPMLSAPEEEIPAGEGWLYEPKWDGFRAIIYREGDRLQIGSRKQQPLERYFPELVTLLKGSLPERAVVDGEIVIAGAKSLDFDALLQRIHPAASRIAKLSQETPSSFVAFDLLALGDEDLRARPFTERRARLAKALAGTERVFLTPQTPDPDTARRWFTEYEGAGLDGIIAKRAEQPYQPGERVMVKVKHHRTADCVVGGYRVQKGGDGVGSLLLGLYDERGVLHHVGHTSGFKAKERRDLREQLRPLEGGVSFGDGRTPGAPSRWSAGKDVSWTAVSPTLVCEVSFDHLQGDRFRHASRFLRWRPDREPKSCTYAQLLPPHPFSLEKIARGDA